MGCGKSKSEDAEGGMRLREEDAGRRDQTLRAGASIGLEVPGASETVAGGGVPKDEVGGDGKFCNSGGPPYLNVYIQIFERYEHAKWN